MKQNIWDKNIPVEKSSYLNNNSLIYYNLESVSFDKNALNMLDLFCGAGGFSVGTSWAGFQTVFGIDYLEPAMKTWVYNHPNSIGCLGDIKKLNPKELKKMLKAKGINKIHLLTGGVPCQGFSRANRKHNDNDERNFLFLEYMRFVKEFQPEYIILENVSGMRSTAGGKFEEEIKKYMIKLGYTPTVKLVNAADYGVPQIRKRLLFVGINNKTNYKKPFVFPKPKFVHKHRTVNDAISDLPKLKNNEKKESYSTSNLTEYQKLMMGLGNIKGIKKPNKLENHISPNHPKETIEMIKKTKQGMPMYKNFKQRIRLDYSQPSPTQLAGGIRPQFQFGHPKQDRGLSIRERARIQSFPDCYVFKGGIVQERVQTGNAVPPLLIYYIANEIYNSIIKEK